MNKLVFVLIYLTGVFVSAIAQILLKKSAEKTYDSKIKEYLNPYVIISYSIFLGATFCTIFAYSGIPLSFGPILAASEYIFVAVLSKLILKEKINKKKITGLAIICLGIIVFVMK
ncbi:MAG: EamA family transporter [Acutalibacteraceae bacterium]|jgi:drug/metabolite transporter (DMT)-like permease|nr:EamA family transporter [Acutalibacteraceae bacterium]